MYKGNGTQIRKKVGFFHLKDGGLCFGLGICTFWNLPCRCQKWWIPGRGLQALHGLRLRLSKSPRRPHERGLTWSWWCWVPGQRASSLWHAFTCGTVLCPHAGAQPALGTALEPGCVGLLRGTQPAAQPALGNENELHIELRSGSCCQWSQWQSTDWFQE